MPIEVPTKTKFFENKKALVPVQVGAIPLFENPLSVRETSKRRKGSADSPPGMVGNCGLYLFQKFIKPAAFFVPGLGLPTQ